MTDTTHIRLCENEDVQAYNKAYANEREMVEEICGNGNQETKDSIVLVDIHDTTILNAATDQRQFVALDMDEITLHKTNSNSLTGGESTQLHIQDDDDTKLRYLSVTVVYSGSFNSVTYSPAVLTVELKQVTGDSTLSIGHSPPDLQRTNTENQLGCTVIQYEHENKVINGGMFQVVVKAKDNDVNYSVSIGVRLACPLTKEVKRRVAKIVATRDEIKQCKEEVSILDKQLVLFERKRRLEDELIIDSKEHSTKCLAKAEKLDLELDYQDDEDEWKTTVAQIEKLKLDSTEACTITAVRSKMKERLSSDIQRTVEERDQLQQKTMRLQTKVDDDITLLTSIVPNVWPSKASEIIKTLLLESDDNT